MRRLKSLVCDEDGQELVEFAFAATALFTLIFGIIGFCLVMYTSSFVTYAAQQGTRYWMVRGSDWNAACATATSYGCQASTDNVKNYVLSLQHPGISLAASNITPTALGTKADGTTAGCTTTPYAQGCQVQVVVNYTFSLGIPFVPAASIPLSSTSVETIQD
jgi:Flp pilus assembly protein TadG